MSNLKMLVLMAAATGVMFTSSGCLVLKSDLKQSQAELEEAKDYAASLRAELTRAKAAHSDEMTQMKDRFQVARTGADEAKAQVATLTEQFSTSTAALEEARARIKSLQDSLDRREGQLAEARSEVEKLRDRAAKLESQVGTLRADLAKAKQSSSTALAKPRPSPITE